MMRSVTSVLLVEDDPADAELLLASLAELGASRPTVQRVGTLTDALDRLDDPDLDVVLLDLSLPDSQDLDTLQRTLDATDDIPVVVLTGNVSDELAAAAIEAGAQDYLVKGSVSGEVVGRVLRHAVERHRLQSELRERAKEASGLYEIERTLHDQSLTTEQCLAQVAALLRAAMRRPPRTHVEVTVDGRTYHSGEPADGESLSAAVQIDRRDRVRVRVTCPGPDPFLLPEEEQLVASVARAVAGRVQRSEAATQLVRETERLRLIVDQLPGLVWTTDSELLVTAYSGSVLSAMGIGSDELIGLPVADLLGIGPNAETLDHLHRALDGEAHMFERHWHGSWWRTYIDAKRDPSGTIRGTVGLSLDVTDEVEQRKELDITRERMEGLFANASDAILLADDDGRYLDANPAACELTGRTREELLGLQPWDLSPGPSPGDDRLTELQDMWRDFIASGTSAGDFPVARPDGTIVQTEFRAVADIVPGVHLSSIRDVTARRQAEEALRASEEQFRQMSESSQDMIYRTLLTPEATPTYLNPATATITGFSAADFQADPTLLRERVHPDDRDRIDPDNLPEEGSITTLFRFQHGDGHWLWLEGRRFAIREDGRLVGVQGIIQDVTGRELSARGLREALAAEQEAADRLHALDDLKNGFLQAISHEVRTPLTSIIGYARTLRDHAGALADDQVEHFHQRLAHNADRLEHLLVDLLDLEGLGRGAVQPNRASTDLGAMLTAVATRLTPSDHHVVVDQSDVVAEVDPDKTERILHGLLDNAARHTPAGTTIEARCRLQDGDVIIEVADDGPGIAPEDLERVFEPFWQGSSVRASARPGTGVGLSLVRQFALLHGGRAWAEARQPSGVVFRVCLPAGSSADNDRDLLDGRAGRLLTILEEARRQLYGVASEDEAFGVLLALVERAGGRTTTDDLDPEVLDIDLSPGIEQRIHPAAPFDSHVREWLTEHLPSLVLLAQRVLTTRRTMPGVPTGARQHT